jgi:hypothetical protein
MSKIHIDISEFIKIMDGDSETISKHRNKLTKICPNCNNSFIPLRKDGICCSQKCTTEKWVKENPERSRQIKKKWECKHKK